MSVSVFFAKLKKIWDELSNYKQIIKQREKDKVHQFLIGLDDSVYGTICSNILQMDPIPNIKKTYQ